MKQHDYLTDYFNKERLDFLKNLKRETLSVFENKEIIVEGERFNVYLFRGQEKAFLLLNDKDKNKHHVFISDKDDIKNLTNEDLFDKEYFEKRLEKYDEEESVEQLFPMLVRVFAYSEKEEEKLPHQTSMRNLVRCFSDNKFVKVFKKDFLGKNQERQIEFAKKYSFENIDKKLLNLLSKEEYFESLYEALKNTQINDFYVSYTLKNFSVFLNEINALSKNKEKFVLNENDLNATIKYAEIYQKSIESWGSTFEMLQDGFIKHGIFSQKKAQDAQMIYPCWLDGDKIIFTYNSNSVIVDFKDNENYVLYTVIPEMGDNIEDIMDKIKKNKVNDVENTTLKVVNGKIKFVDPVCLYSFKLDLEFATSKLLEMGILESMDETKEYDYQMKYHSKLYNVSELNMLFRAFAGLGTGMEYDKEKGLFFEPRTLKDSKLGDYKKVSDEYEEMVYLTPVDDTNVRGLKIPYLNEDWHNGLKKLLSHYSKHKENIEKEMNDFFMNPNLSSNQKKFNEDARKEFCNRQFTSLEKMMKKLLKIDKDLDKENKKLQKILQSNEPKTKKLKN